MIEITEEMLGRLREAVVASMSLKRYRHTAAVEEMAARLAELYCPELVNELRAAALLHDITKERTTEEQVALCNMYGLAVTEEELCAPKTFHARTAAALIGAEYPEYATDTVVSAVRWHTTGHADMTVPERLLYLADYIDLSRTFSGCVLLRRYFWGADPVSMNAEERNALLTDTLILSYDMTIRDLLEDGKLVATDTVQARNALIKERLQHT